MNVIPKQNKNISPCPTPQPPDVIISLIFTRWDWWEHHSAALQTPSHMARNQSEQPLMGTRCFILIRSWLELEVNVFLTRIFWGLSCDNKWPAVREPWHGARPSETQGLSSATTGLSPARAASSPQQAWLCRLSCKHPPSGHRRP